MFQISQLVQKLESSSHLLWSPLSTSHSPKLETMESLNCHADPDKVTETIAAAMQHDLIARYFQLDSYEIPNSTIITLEQSTRFFHDLLDSLYEAGAFFVETRESGGAAVWYSSLYKCYLRVQG
jgi:hypothetical protein